MINKKLVLATICARGGSKGIKHKNIKELANKPLILYTLEIIEKSKFIDDYVISTDDQKIADVCMKNGYKIDFSRPEKLAKDKVSRLDVVKHAVEWKFEHDKKYDIIVDLGVATPFKTAEDVDKAIEKLVNNDINRVTSVMIADRNPYYNMLERKNGKIDLCKKAKIVTDRRDAPEVFNMNDGINVWKYDWLFEVTLDKIYVNCEIYVMSREKSIDIDDMFDFSLAEMIIKRNGIYEI